MSICCKCKKDLPQEEFTKNKQKKNGYNSVCKSCNRLYLQQYYHDNKGRIMSNSRRYARRRRQKYREIMTTRKKELGKCYVCTEDYLGCLEFHHVQPENKKFTLGDKYTFKVPVKQLMEEMDKCILLCANCHKKYHRGKPDVVEKVNNCSLTDSSKDASIS